MGPGAARSGRRGNARAVGRRDLAHQLGAHGAAEMVEIVGAYFTSHVPAIGGAIHRGAQEEPYWKPLFEGYEFSKKWMAEQKPDVAIIVYNDHASYFGIKSLKIEPMHGLPHGYQVHTLVGQTAGFCWGNAIKYLRVL